MSYDTKFRSSTTEINILFILVDLESLFVYRREEVLKHHDDSRILIFIGYPSLHVPSVRNNVNFCSGRPSTVPDTISRLSCRPSDILFQPFKWLISSRFGLKHAQKLNRSSVFRENLRYCIDISICPLGIYLYHANHGSTRTKVKTGYFYFCANSISTHLRIFPRSHARMQAYF